MISHPETTNFFSSYCLNRTPNPPLLHPESSVWAPRPPLGVKQQHTRKAGMAQQQSVRLVIRRSWVWVQAWVAGKCSSPPSNFCANSYFGICSTPGYCVAYKISRSFCLESGGMLQLNPHAPYVCGFKESDTVNWCMVVWCKQNVRREGSSFTWHHAVT